MLLRNDGGAMAKTTAERQANYRNNRAMVGESGEKRINTWVSTGSHMALSRLANRYGVTKREMSCASLYAFSAKANFSSYALRASIKRDFIFPILFK